MPHNSQPPIHEKKNRDWPEAYFKFFTHLVSGQANLLTGHPWGTYPTEPGWGVTRLCARLSGVGAALRGGHEGDNGDLRVHGLEALQGVVPAGQWRREVQQRSVHHVDLRRRRRPQAPRSPSNPSAVSPPSQRLGGQSGRTATEQHSNRVL